jgi:hypothetical protein
MLAQGEDIDILDNHQLIVVLVEDRTVHQVPDILLVALGEVKHGLGVSQGGLAETLTLWVLSNTFEDCPDGSRKLLKSLFGLFRGRLFPLSSSGAWWR